MGASEVRDAASVMCPVSFISFGIVATARWSPTKWDDGPSWFLTPGEWEMESCDATRDLRCGAGYSNGETFRPCGLEGMRGSDLALPPL